MNKVDAEKVMRILLTVDNGILSHRLSDLLVEFCYTFPIYKSLALNIFKEKFGDMFTKEQWKSFVDYVINID